MDAVPLVTSYSDPRNIISLVFYSALTCVSAKLLSSLSPKFCQILKKTIGPNNPSESLCLSKERFEPARRKIDTIQVIAVSLSLVILPALPATNLFFYVGFVLAERVLYLPSLGYCLILSYSLEQLAKQRGRAVKAGTLTLVLLFTLKTLSRNRDWSSEEALFSSGLGINPAKSWSNYGNILDGQGNLAGAELAFKQALIHRPNMADTHYNLGILLQNQQRLHEAAAAYKAAIRFRPRLGLAYLNLGLTLSHLGHKSEAMSILEACSKVDDNGLKDPAENVNARISAMLHLGKLLLESGDSQTAISILQRAANTSRREGEARSTTAPHLEKVLNLLGDAFQHTGKTSNTVDFLLV